MSITHDKQERLRAATALQQHRADGALLTHAQFQQLTDVGRRDYLRQLSDEAFWRQAEVIAAAWGKPTIDVIAHWGRTVL